MIKTHRPKQLNQLLLVVAGPRPFLLSRLLIAKQLRRKSSPIFREHPFNHCQLFRKYRSGYLRQPDLL